MHNRRVLIFSSLLLWGVLGSAQTEQSTLPLAPEKKSEAISEKTEKQKTKLDLVTTFRAASVEDKVVNSKMAGGILEVIGEREFTSYLSSRFDAGMLLMTGTYTNRYTSEGAAPTGVELYTAIVDLHPARWSSLQVGVLDVDFSSILSTFNTQGFPGVRGVLTGKTDLFETSVQASQTVPTSGTPEVKSSESGINTTLNIASASVASNPDKTLNVTVKASATHFQFSNLTSSAATDSKYLGNSTINVGSQARFKYQFEGNEYAGQVKYEATKKLKFELSGSQLVNDKAPEGANKANLITGSGTYALNGVNLTLGGGTFANETDSLPGSFTYSRFGNNNRFGWTATFLAEFEKQKATVFGRFVQANQMETQDRPFQADRQILSFGVEAKYEIL